MISQIKKQLVNGWIVAWLILVAGVAQAQHTELEKKVAKTYNVSSSLQFSVKNKFGKVEITTWNNPQIDVEVVIKVKNRTSQKRPICWSRSMWL